MNKRVQECRKNPTEAELILWYRIRKKQLGVKFRRQHPIEPYIVDFFCSSARLVIEIDGESHHSKKLYDNLRKTFLESMNLKVLTFSNKDIYNDLENTLSLIKQYL